MSINRLNVFFLWCARPPVSTRTDTPFPYTTPFRSVFDDPNLVSTAGLVPAMLLAESAGLHDLLDAKLTVNSPNATVKATSVIAGMLTGADSIDDLDVLRHGGRSEEHTSELQSLMRISYAVFCLKKKKKEQQIDAQHITKKDRQTKKTQ